MPSRPKRSIRQVDLGAANTVHTHTESDITDLDHTDDNAIHDNVSGEIAAITAKATPVDADVTVIEDSEAANAKKSLSWANIKATLKTYFDTLYAAVVHSHTESDIADLDHWDQTDTEGVIDAYVDKTFVDALNVDADTLDGQDSTDFAAATHDHDADYAWQTWSPSYEDMTIGNGTVVSRYAQIGKTVVVRFLFTLGSTSAIGTSPEISVPVAPHASYLDNRDIVGNALLADVGTALFQGQVQFIDSLTNFVIVRTVVSGANVAHGTVSSSAPFAWTTGDQLGFQAMYEAA